MPDKPILNYATPEPAPRVPVRPRRRSGAMGLFLGLAWLPSAMVYDNSIRGKFLSGATFGATVGLILFLHREFTRRRRGPL